MTSYYQLSRDYDLAVDLLNKKNRLPVYLTDEDGDVNLCTMWLNEDSEIMVDDRVEVFAIAHLEFFFNKNSAQFLLPIPDPTTELQHSLTSALNECDELRDRVTGHKNLVTIMEVEIKRLQVDVAEYKKAQNFANSASGGADLLRLELNQRIEALDFANSRIKDLQVLIEEKNEAIADLQSDLDTAKNELTVANAVIEELQTRDSKLGTDLIDEMNNTAQLDDMIEERDRTISNLKIQIEGRDAALSGSVATFKELKAENEAYKKAIDAMSPNFANAGKIYELEQIIQRDRSNADRAIQSLKTMNSIYQSDIKKLDREIEMLQEALESAQSLHESQVSILKGSLDELKICRREYLGRIQTLENNLDEFQNNRLSQLTSIMRNIQALEETPQDKLSGALYLIRRMLYEAICRLDPSQAYDI